MADYTINIEFNDNDSGRKLDDLDKKIGKVAKTHKVEFKFPDLEKTKRDLQEVGKYAGLAATAFKNFTPVGKQFSEIEGNVKVVGAGLANVGRTLAGMSVYLNPIRGMSDGFAAVATSVDSVIANTARLGFAIFGVTQSVNVLKAAFGQMFDDTVGREIRLRETLLQTATTLAGTNRIFLKGVEIEDPTQKLQALEGSVTASIDRIRERSLEIAGTTSEAVIATFNVVASQIGSFGGTLKQAEDLAVKFSGALGTLGMNDPMYARQEIGSIMMGYVDQNSVLAKTIGITNADIQRAKQSGELVDFISKKLEVFEAGQKTAAKGFSGVTSNIQEMAQELKRAFGSQLLDPILARISKLYETVSGKSTIKELMQTSRAFGQLIGGTLNTAYGTVANTPVLKQVDTRAIESSARKLQEIFARVSEYIQALFARLGPTIERLVTASVSSIATLGRAFSTMAATLGRVKLDQLTVRLQALTALTPGIVVAANAYAEYLKTIEAIVNTPIGRYVNEVKEMNKVLKDFGVTGLINSVIAIKELKAQLPILAAQIKAIGDAIGKAAQATLVYLGNLYSRVAAGAIQATTRLTAAFTGAFTRITLGLSKLTVELAKFFSTLSVTVRLIGSEWAQLAGPLQRFSTELQKISVQLQKASQNAQKFGQDAQASMARASAGAQQAGASMALLGVKLKDGAAKGAAAASTAILGFVGGILKTSASMALWTIGLSLLFDGLRRISEWWDNFSQDQKYKQSLDQLNNGFLEQAQAARAAGREIDAVTAARQRMIQTDLDTKLQKEIAELIKLEDELKRRGKNIGALRESIRQNNRRADEDGNLTNEQVALKRDPEFAKQIAERKRLIKEAEDALNKLLGKNPNGGADPQLRAQENKQQIQDLANFEKETRRSIEDEVYNYRRQAQDKELQNWRQAGELRIQQIDQGNRALIEGVDSEARASLEALNNWIITKQRGELDIEAKKKEAQMAAAELERAIGRFRMNLEKQVAEIRKRINQYEIEVLDKRIQAEQLIANIRNGSIVWEADGASGAGNTATNGDPTNADVIARAAKATENLTGINNQCAEAVKRFMTILGISSNVMDKSAASAQRMGRVMTDWSKLQPGDIVARGRVGDPQHVGVFTGGNNVFHQSGTRGLKTGNYPDLDYFKEQGYFIRPYAAQQFTGRGNLSSQARALVTAANKLGVSPLDLATIIGFETGGTYSPSKKGGAGNNYLGLIQFGPPERSKYGAHAGQTFEEQIQGPVVRYFEDRFKSVGMSTRGASLLDLYTTVLAGNPKANRNAQDSFGTSPTSGVAAMGPHRQEALRRFFGGSMSNVPGGASAAAPGSASLAAVGGAPTQPNVTLQIDTSELDAAQEQLRKATEQAIELSKQSNDLTNADNFNKFVQSLNTTRPELERTSKELRNQEIELKAINKATEGGIYDPKVLEVNIRHQQNLKAVEKLKATQLDIIKKQTFSSEADRAKAQKAVEDNYKNELKNLEEIRKTTLSLVNLEKQRERITGLNQQRAEAQLNFERERVQVQTQITAALFDENDALGARMAEAESLIKQERLRYTNNDKEPMSSALQKSFDAFAEEERTRARQRASDDQALTKNRKLRELENKILQQRIEQTKGELSVRTEAAKEALDPRNFKARRRLDAERTVYEEYLNMSNGGTMELDNAAREKLQKFAEETLKSADSMALLDKEMESFTSRLALARESAQTFVSGYKQMLSSIMAGGDVKEAVNDMTKNIADFFTGKILDYAFKPMEQQMEGLFRTLFGVQEPEERNTQALQALTEAIRNWKPTDPAAATAVTPTAPGSTTPEVATPATEATSEVTKSTAKLGEGMKDTAAKTSEATTQTLSNLQKYTSGLAQVGAYAMGIVGGIENMKKGGTYNVLSGLSSIFGSLGGAFGMFAPKGIFGGARALGGPVSARVPYLVGEKGPELFIPEAGGQVMSNTSTQSMFQRTREALQAQQRPAQQAPAPTPSSMNRPLEVRYESQVINNVEYVTADQHRKGMEQAARRGQLLAYQGMQNSVKVRRRLSL